MVINTCEELTTYYSLKIKSKIVRNCLKRNKFHITFDVRFDDVSTPRENIIINGGSRKYLNIYHRTYHGIHSNKLRR